jgi:penicillin-binding protein 1A
LTKDQILEIYMNQIFLGNRAYGFSAASEIYFRQAPQGTSPSPKRPCWRACPKPPPSTTRSATHNAPAFASVYIIDRMVENGFISPKERTMQKIRTQSQAG